MKNVMQKILSFITFDFAFDRNCLTQQFNATQALYQSNIPFWSTNSTRQKVIGRYWFELVLTHFSFLFGLPALLFLMTSAHFESAQITIIFLAALITFSTLMLFVYWPGFYNSFLPQLETIKEIHERKQFDQLEKCKRAQFSNPALVLIYYVFDKLGGNNSLQCNDRYAELLTKLFGVDQGSIKKNLELFLGKRKNLSERKYTEISNRFQEARSFFEELQFKEAQQILDQLEQKFKVS
ncbi:hypothetical protein [Segetibacter aerophilus]|uniref:Uncharacterized protein n=1 Tax=Segetibacter aerophilus TaxID=670293 RepID=A0A512BHD2_9BACT|nr:hypothetical protein [Segetibacter aerophilus]GEO11374.1 hypothetical protein SAE01_38700 [Segetibacter aerophilus]